MTDEFTAAYATNVKHYHEVTAAMLEQFSRVTLMRRREVTPQMQTALSRLPLPVSAKSGLARRVGRAMPPGVDVRGIGLAYEISLLAAKFRYVPVEETRRRVERAASFIASRVDHDLFHFVEGLGHRALRERRFAYSVMERRNFHHKVFEEPIDALLGFPHVKNLDPFADLLEEEYERSDLIMVYSEAVKQSFTSRGFSDRRVVVVPLAVPQGKVNEGRGARREEGRLLYVGRGDAFKGIDVAVAATLLLGAGYRLIVAGPFPPAAQEWLRSFPQIEYVGILGPDELAREYARASRLLSPSVESFGLAVLEAASAGLRVIARETTGAAQLLPDSAVRVVHGRDPGVWAASVAEDIAEHGWAWAALGGGDMGRIRPRDVTEQLVDFYRDITFRL